MGSTRRQFVKGSLAAWVASQALGRHARAAASEIPKRALGKTGVEVTLFGLGGEGVLRSDGREAEATRVIEAALSAGVNYFDTAPAYSSSELYLGRVLPPHRARIFLASKTHDRTREGALRLLDRTLSRLRTDHLDLWQLHDLRDQEDLDLIFGKQGALEAALRARDEKKIRFIGITGHHDPAILVEAMRRHRFDTALLALNAADRVRLPFTTTALAAAREKSMGVIAMKVMGHGPLVAPGGLAPGEAMGWALSQPGVSLSIIGCSTPEEVVANARTARAFKPLPSRDLLAIETRAARLAHVATTFKRS